MCANRGDQVAGAAIVQEEDSLPESPQRGGSELITTGAALSNVIVEPVAHVMDFQIAVEVRGYTAETGRDIGSRAGQRRCVASRATNRREERLSGRNRSCATGCRGRGSWRGQQSHEDGELDRVTGSIHVTGVKVRGIFRCSVDLAVCWQARGLAFTRQRTLLLEHFVGYALFNVVGLTGEDEHRFVLGLPAETRNGTVISVAIEGSADSKRAGVGGEVIQQRGFINVLHQAGAESWRGNAEDDVTHGLGLREAGLRDVAGSGIRTASNGEQVFHAAVRVRGIGIAEGVKEEWKTNFTHRATGGDERRDGIPGAVCGCVCYLGVNGRAAAACCWLGMTESAASGVVTGAKARACFNGSGNGINFPECSQSSIEERKTTSRVIGRD